MNAIELRTKRLNQGTTARFIAGKLGISPGYLHDMELGRKPMHEKHLTAYVLALNPQPIKWRKQPRKRTAKGATK